MVKTDKKQCKWTIKQLKMNEKGWKRLAKDVGMILDVDYEKILGFGAKEF